MTREPLSYPQILGLVNQGVFVTFATGTVDGEPMLAYMAARPDPTAARFAHHPDERIRAAQATGVIAELRQRARAWGFTPA